jgi:hypothetical protein
MRQLKRSKGGPCPSILLTATVGRPNEGVVAFGGPYGPHRTPSWVGGRSGFPCGGGWMLKGGSRDQLRAQIW